LLLLTSDSAVEDYHQRGLSWQVLTDNGFGILLSRLSFRITRMPEANEIITIHTWEEAPQGLQLYRAYEICAQNGTPLINGISSWLVISLETRRILKPSQFTMRELPTRTLPLKSMECGKIAVPDTMKLLDERKIRYSDIDANGHMNNSRYGAFVIDCLPTEYQQKTFTDFRINFSKEAVKDAVLQLYGSYDELQRKVTVVGRQNTSTCFESELYY
jgi:acyl-ACP thioesterase